MTKPSKPDVLAGPDAGLADAEAIEREIWREFFAPPPPPAPAPRHLLDALRCHLQGMLAIVGELAARK